MCGSAIWGRRSRSSIKPLLNSLRAARWSIVASNRLPYDGHWGKATGQKVRLGLRSKDGLPHAVQFLIDLSYIKRFGIEIAANPFREFSVLRVGGISHCLEKIFVAAQSPHVFRGTRASPRQARSE